MTAACIYAAVVSAETGGKPASAHFFHPPTQSLQYIFLHTDHLTNFLLLTLPHKPPLPPFLFQPTW